MDTTRRAVASRVHSAAIHLLRRLRLRDQASGIGPAQLSALSVLVFVGPRTTGELARIEQVRPPTMSQIVSALETGGLVRRRPDPSDRRVSHLEPTAKGVRLMKRAQQARIEGFVELLAECTAEELAELDRAASLIERLVRTRAPE